MITFGGDPGRHRLGHQCLRQFAGAALRRRGDLRYGRRRDLRDLRRQCGEVVPGSPRPCRRARPRRAFGAGAALTVIPIRLLIDTLGYGDAFLWFGMAQGVILLFVAQILRGRGWARCCGGGQRSGAAIGTQLHQRRDAALTGFLAAVRHVRAELGERADGDRAARTDRQGFRTSPTPILFGATMLSVALVVDNVLNGLARPFFGGSRTASAAN